MLNKVFLMGRMVATPELRRTKSDLSVCSFRIAVDRDFTGKGEEKETDFFDCVAWRKTGEVVSKYFNKGDPSLLDGRLQMRDWQTKEGEKRRSYEIVVDNARFCGGKKKEGTAVMQELDDDDGELPFSVGEEDQLPL